MNREEWDEAGLREMIPLTRLEVDGRITLRHRQINKQMVIERLHLFERLLYPVMREESRIDNFVRYINKKWLVSDISDSDDVRDKRIFRREDREEIVRRAIYHRVCDVQECKVTFVKIMKHMSEKMGYHIETSREVIDGGRERYRLIVSFNETEYEQYQTGRKPIESATEYDESEDIKSL